MNQYNTLFYESELALDLLGNNFHLREPVYRIILNGDGVFYPVELHDKDLEHGVYTFKFRIIDLHSSLILSVQVYEYNPETETGEYVHIPGSPFELIVDGRTNAAYCTYSNLREAGFGFTNNTYVESYGAV